MHKETREELSRQEKKLALERESISDIRQLVREMIDLPHPLNLWDLSERELDSEMGNRLSSLNEDIDTRPRGEITSHRRLIGPLVIGTKRILRRLFTPYSNLLLARQTKFNEDLVAFQLAAFIRFRHLEKRLAAMEERITDIEESLHTLSKMRGPDAGGSGS